MKWSYVYLGWMILMVGQLKCQNIEVGIGYGLAVYDGELSPKDPAAYIDFISPNYSLECKVHLFRWFGIKSSFQHTVIIADGIGASLSRPMQLKTPIYELALLGSFTPARWYPFKGSYFSIAPYFESGAVFFHFQPLGKYKGGWADLRTLGTEGQGANSRKKYDQVAYAFPINLGLRIQLSKRVAVSALFESRYTFTDYIDDISYSYVDYELVKRVNGPIAAHFSSITFHNDPAGIPERFQRGGKAMDYYFTGHINLNIRLGKIHYLNDPLFSYPMCY